MAVLEQLYTLLNLGQPGGDSADFGSQLVDVLVLPFGRKWFERLYFLLLLLHFVDIGWFHRPWAILPLEIGGRFIVIEFALEVTDLLHDRFDSSHTLNQKIIANLIPLQLVIDFFNFLIYQV